MIEDGYPIVDTWRAFPGAKAGSLTLIEIDHKDNSHHTYWKCSCSCGKPNCAKIAIIRQDNLSAGARGKDGTRSCGTKQSRCFINPNRQGLIDEDLTGQTLNNWKVIQKTNMHDSNRSIMYLCQSISHPAYYDILSARHLKDGHVANARCAKLSYKQAQAKYYTPKIFSNLSKPEQKILNMLKELKFKGSGQVKYDLCKDKLPLPFDFVITYPSNYIIEYDGGQHFKPAFGGGEEELLLTRAHDLIKNKFCFDNHIPLIRIPFNANFTKEDLILEKTKFLLTPENEEQYYENRN